MHNRNLRTSQVQLIRSKKRLFVCSRPTNRPESSDRKTFFLYIYFFPVFSKIVVISYSETWLTALICRVYRCFDIEHTITLTPFCILADCPFFSGLSRFLFPKKLKNWIFHPVFQFSQGRKIKNKK